MYGWDSLVLLQHLLDEGLTKTAIAQRLGVSRRVVHHWIATGQVNRDLDAPPPRRYPPRPTQLDLFTSIITARLETYPELSAVRLFDEVRAAGYQGGITQVRAYVARVRPRPAPEAVVRYETPPGHQAQVDFAEFRLPWGKRYALVVVLGYSRLLWLKFYPRQTLTTVISGIEDAFGYFGGVPTELLLDQMKAVIVDDQRADGGTLLENPEFLRVAAHWGFRIRACRPYRAQTKGKVERPIRYVRGNFFYGREFIGDADLDAQCLAWLDGVANVRTHRTTQCVPRVRFETDEVMHLQPLAARAYRPLVLPVERTTRRTVPHILAPTVPRIVVEQRGAPQLSTARRRGGVMNATPSRRDHLRSQLADLKMPGALEALDDILAGLDGGTLTAPAALDALLAAQIALRNHRRLDAAMRSSRLPP